MNRKILVISFLILGLIVGVPFLATLKNNLLSAGNVGNSNLNSQQSSGSSSSTSVGSPNQTLPQQLTPPPQAVAPPIPSGPPDFTGTVWQVNTPYGPVQVQLNPGGQAVATHPMVGTVTGTWRQVGNQLSITASFMGQTYNISAEIRGNALYYQGMPITRLR